MDNILLRDLQNISSANFIPWEQLKGKTIFVTGATGLIGFNVVSGLLYANEIKKLGLTVLALVRNEERARQRFSDFTDCDALKFIISNVETLPRVYGVDYIIHGASQTASKVFVEQPVETIMTALSGTHNVLELAKLNNVKGMVYLSSMEVYGHPEKGHKVTEDDIGTMSPLDVRNSYPISKLQCESLCHAYACEYGLNITIARLTQTFGAGASENDNRIFAYFSKCVKNRHNIVLNTKGDTERCYLYTSDAVTAILTLLLKGESGRAYNLADEKSYCSIAQMAEKIALAHGIKVIYNIQDEGINGYPATIYMDLDTSKLRALGWRVLHNYNFSNEL